jgi:hypothetical protein
MSEPQGPAPPSDDGLFFVHNDSAHQASNNAVRRSHVMREYWRKKRARSPNSGPAEPSGHQPFEPSAARLNFRLPKQDSKRARGRSRKTPSTLLQKQPGSAVFRPASAEQAFINAIEGLGTYHMSDEEKESLLRLATSVRSFFQLGASGVDPFGVIPLNLTAQDEHLLSRFSHYQKWPWCPVSGQNLWPRFALSGRLIFSTTMYAWSMAFRSRLTGSDVTTWLENNPEVLKHKVATIALVNQSLQDVNTAVNDQTVAAVAALANIELVFKGRCETTTYHMKGLRDLVALRGGLHTLGTPLQSLIRRLVSWTDLIYAGLYQQPLYFPRVELWDVAWQTLDQLSLPGSPICLAPDQIKQTGISNHEVIEILEITRQLSLAYRRRPPVYEPEAQRMQHADKCMALETRLSRIIQSTNQPSPFPGDPWSRPVWRSTALATMLYVHHFLRGVPLNMPQFHVWTEQLQQALSEPQEAFGQLAFARALLLWVLSVASITSTVADTRAFFVGRLAATCRQFNLDLEKLSNILSGFIWTGEKDDDLWAVWADVRTHQAMNKVHAGEGR